MKKSKSQNKPKAYKLSNLKQALADSGMTLTTAHRPVNNTPGLLTRKQKTLFRVVFNDQLESEYCFGVLDQLHNNLSQSLSDSEKLERYEALGRFIDKNTKKSITSVLSHKRDDDLTDEIADPLTSGPKQQVIHLYCELDDMRLHGYFNAQNYFVITRVDWMHLFHKRQKRSNQKIT